jgi:N6-adenosine-specific RNA methylase IME4
VEAVIRIDPEFRALIPPLSDGERRQLEANLATNGCRDPLVVWNGMLLDGHHRYELCTANGWSFTTVEHACTDRDDAKVWIIQNQFGRRNLQPYQRAELALTLKPLIAAKAHARMVAGTPVQKSDQGRTAHELARFAGLSHDTIAKAAVIADQAPEAVKAQLRSDTLSINQAYHEIRTHERRAERVERIQAITANNTALDTERPVPILLADPPWQYEHVNVASYAPENHYPTMTLDDICAPPVKDAATPDAVLFLWAPAPKLAEAFRVIDAWGFNYRTHLVWRKDRVGMGYYARPQHENLLIAMKGDLPVPAPENRPPSVVDAERRAHSQKPDVFYRIIEAMYPEFEKRELFARQVRPGWLAWGNQVK